MRARKRGKKMVGAVIIIVIACLLFWSNITIKTSYHIIRDAQIPAQFDGFKIIQISDYHNSARMLNKSNLIPLIKTQKPDIIVVTGDLIDSYHTDVSLATALIFELSNIAPIYYVTGNHESRLPDAYQQLRANMIEHGVTILDNKATQIKRENEAIQIIGIDDPDFTPDSNKDVIIQNLSEIKHHEEQFSILLSHRPEYFPLYSNYGINLIFSGHAHGGQIRFPIIGGVFAPNQGFFPKYTSGKHTVNNSTMIISRGLGNSSFPLRINNRPELIVVELRSK